MPSSVDRLERGGAALYVSPQGSDSNPGTEKEPFATLEQAQQAVREAKSGATGPVTVYVREGTYYLPAALTFGCEDSGTAESPVVYAAYADEEVVISGGTRLQLAWEPYRDGILRAVVPAGTEIDQLFVNGERYHMARYPNVDPNVLIYNGYSADCFAPERATRWRDPSGGFIHAMHSHMWGGYHYVITGKDDAGNITYEGGWQNNRQMGMHEEYRFVENIFEELDAPGEWFLDTKQNLLYAYPYVGTELSEAVVETARLRHLVEFKGTEAEPVRGIALQGFTFRHARRTFMDTREPLLRSDWTIYRGGAVLFEGSEDCTIEDCYLDQVGGNAVFASGYNRRIAIRGCHIADAGANGVSFVGSPSAVRSPLFEYAERQRLEDIDLTPGPLNNEYPADCVVEDCLIYRSGRFEKQTAPVQISMAQSITVRHCSLYVVPRAGINVSEGTWGGHLIEHNDVFDTVLETGDHGSFNSWGRDRYWELEDADMNGISPLTASEGRSELPLLDAVLPVTIRGNRFRCDHGWDIDLDDGSSHYHIYNNLCLNGGIKLREGFYRVCENNVMVNNSFHPHVWYVGSQDVFRHNIVLEPYQPIRVPQPWGESCDCNFLHVPGQASPEPAAALQVLSGSDARSLAADALFLNPAGGDYRVAEGSPALTVGFRNFAMDSFGVKKASLRRIAKTPQLPNAASAETGGRDRAVYAWQGLQIKNIVGLGEVSACGLPGETGVWVTSIPADHALAAAGLQEADVILRYAGKRIDNVNDLLAVGGRLAVGGQLSDDAGDSDVIVQVVVFRHQREHVIDLTSQR